jgi:hypothetical protein
MKMVHFDPRSADDRQHDEHNIMASIQQLTDAEPNTCLRLMWGIHPMPPDFTEEIELECMPTMDQQTDRLKLYVGMGAAFPSGQLDEELVSHIEHITRQQDKCDLWHELHIGRLTSSSFGQIFRSKNSPSLLHSILTRK